MSDPPGDSTALLTDHYELTMLQAALKAGTAHRRGVFEVFARRLSGGRRYGVVAGTGRLLDAIEKFRFTPGQLDWLEETSVVDPETRDWLANFKFSGDVWGYREGELFFPGSPIFVVEASFAEGVILETLILSVFNHDSAIATAAARMVSAANGRPCFDMGSRRTHERSAVSAARAAFVAGFAGTSNLEAGATYPIATIGTAAHAFTLLHDTERDAFEAQVNSLGVNTTILVDTYDIETGVRTAIDVAGPELGGVRIDSGDLGATARSVRALLDDLGATSTRITVTSDLDEHAIAGLASAPVDSYGIGTSLVTGSGVPTVGFVYKLVARTNDEGTLEPVAKKSQDKLSIGGRKHAARQLNDQGCAIGEVLTIGPDPETSPNRRALLKPLIVKGQRVDHSSLTDAQERFKASFAELPLAASRLSPGDPAIETIYQENP